MPLVTCTKVLAYQNGITKTNTIERLKALAQAGIVSVDQQENLEQAQETLLTLKIKNDIKGIDEGKEFGTHINPSELSVRQKQLLKEAFWTVSELQKIAKNRLKVDESSFGI
jgi:CBS domain-containing protein